MGISGLQTFIKREANGVYEQVDLSEIVDLYRNEKKIDPVLIIDISSFVTIMADSNKSVQFMLGELKKKKENFELFVKKFTDLGIKITAVFDGMKTHEKLNVWPEKQKKKLLLVKKLFSGESYDINENREGIGIFLHIAQNVFLANEKCEVVRSLYEADSEIASRKSQCFAILSHDSDFLMLEGPQYLLTVEDFNLDSMTVYNYNRNRFAESLKISPSLLPLYASLCFHTHLDTTFLNRFYKQHKIRPNKRFKDVARFVRKFSSGEKVLENLLESKTVMGMNQYMLKERVKYFSGIEDEKDIKLTECPQWNEILILAKKNFQTCQGNKKILEILVNKANILNFSSINVFKMSPITALRPLRKKIYGILFFEYPFSTVNVRELSFEAVQEGKPHEFCDTIVSFAPRSHVGLLTLWSSDRTSNDVNEQRLKVFCQTINEKLIPDDLKSEEIPEEFIFPLLAAFILRWETNSDISFQDLRVILIHAVIANRLTGDEVTRYPDKIYPEALHLCGWFVETVWHLYFLDSVCGNPFSVAKTNMLNFFDGKIFHYVWAETDTAEMFLKTDRQEAYHQYNSLSNKLFELARKCGYTVP